MGRSKKRDNILDTAEKLFYEEGFHATGIDRVVEQAGVARMTLYNHFASKEALVEAVLKRRHERYFAMLEEAVVDARARGKEPLLALVEAHCQWLGTIGTHGCLFLRAVAEYEAHAPSVHGLALEYKQALITWIGKLAPSSQAAHSHCTAEELFLILEGANALVQVIGPARAIQHTHGLTRRLLLQSPEGTAS